MSDAKLVHSEEPPLVIFFPGLGEREAEDFAPFQHVLRIVPVAYWDWREWVQPGRVFEDMIAHLKRQIQCVNPPRPVCLVGYSIGGPLAYACALELESEGFFVDCLAILDGSSKPGRTTLKKHFENLLTFEVRSGLASILAKVLVQERAMPLLRYFCRHEHISFPFNFSTYLDPMLRTKMMWRNFVVWWRSRSLGEGLLTTPVFVFRSAEHQSQDEYDLGWGRYCRNVNVIPIEGDHNSMLAPENLGPLCGELARISRSCSAQ